MLSLCVDIPRTWVTGSPNGKSLENVVAGGLFAFTFVIVGFVIANKKRGYEDLEMLTTTDLDVV